MSNVIPGPDGKARCRWCSVAPEFVAYHDTEWGFPVDDDHRLFEKISLEAFQSGLSWRTILAKRENFRAAFRIKRRKFTDEQKAEAVEIYRRSGKTVAAVARDLDLTASALAEWIKQADVDEGRGPAAGGWLGLAACARLGV